MAINYTSTGVMPLSKGVKVLVYSDAGLGKTMLCATAPTPLLISAESGLLSLQKKNIERVFGVNQPGICYDIPVAPIKSLADLNEVYNMLAAGTSIQTVCLDSLSEIAETVLAHAMTTNNDGRAAFGEMATEIIEQCRKFRDLPNVHTYFSAKRGYSDDSRKNGPSMPGQKLSRELPYLFDEVFQLDLFEASPGTPPVRFLRTSPDLKNYAKDRSGALDPMGELPNLTNIFDKISQQA